MDRIATMFNKFASENEAMIHKALSSASNSGGPLIPEMLREAITNTVIRISPMVMMLTTKKWDHGKTYRFNQRTSTGRAGSVSGENATLRQRSSTVVDKTFDLKIIKSKIRVTNFLRAATKSRLDAALYELNNGIEQHAWDLEWLILYGNELANQYEFGGISRFAQTSRIQFNNASGLAVKPSDTSILDKMINFSNRKGGARHRRAFIMSPELMTLFTSLQTQTVRQIIDDKTSQLFVPITMDGGWTMLSYKGIPIIESTFTSGIGASTMGSITSGSGGTTGGTLSDGTYYFRIAKVDSNGESMASSLVTVTLSGATATQKIDLSWPEDAEAQQYYIYYSSANTLQTQRLIRVLSGRLYDSDGNETANRTSYQLLNVTADASVPAAQANDMPLTANSGVNGELMVLWDLDDVQGMGGFPYINDDGSEVNGLVTVEPLAKVEDWIDTMVKTYGGLEPAWEATSVVVKGVAAA